MSMIEPVTLTETPPEIASRADIDREIDAIIERTGLVPTRNRFFRAAAAAKEVRGVAALLIATYWRETTKTFMFTTMAGLGRMAKEAALDPEPPSNELAVIQTLFRVIGDDLNNEMPIFKAAAPAGVGGIHYVWWQDSVLRPIADRLGLGPSDPLPPLPPNIQALRENMHRLSETGLGTAVQLRVVEAIALEICIAFKRIFSKVVIGGANAFPCNDQLSWMNSHIQAEVAHSSEVSDHETGMASLADTGRKQAEMLRLASEYCQNWNAALDDFATALG